MHVICKNCGSKISVSHRPAGSIGASGIRTRGPVSIGNFPGGGTGIGLGPGGSISFGPGGGISFGSRPPASPFFCLECQEERTYDASEIRDD